jgi:hypothetical protein
MTDERAAPPDVTRSTDSLLACGIAAAVLYVGTGIAQFLFRDGLDIRVHQLSVAGNGDLGWVQIANFVLTGGLTMAAALGMHRALAPGPAARWAPRLVAAYGAGLVGAGIFRADPINGFPPGTPAGPPAAPTWHAGVHLAVASLAFVALIAACFVLDRRFAAEGRPGWRTYTLVTGGLLLLTWLGIGLAPGIAVINVAFVVAALHAGVWVAAVAARLRHHT